MDATTMPMNKYN